MKRLALITSLRKLLRWGGLAIGLLSVALLFLCCVVQVRSYFASDDFSARAVADDALGYDGPVFAGGILLDKGRINVCWLCWGPFPILKLLRPERPWMLVHRTREPGDGLTYMPAGRYGFGFDTLKRRYGDYSTTEVTRIMFPNLVLLALSAGIAGVSTARHLRRRPVARFEVLVKPSGGDVAKTTVAHD
jgi:hypothetical protein